MKAFYQDGKIVAKGCNFEAAYYDMANNAIAVQADGKGFVTSYAVVGDKTYYRSTLSSLKFIIGGKQVDFRAPKTVEMLGRKQTVTVNTQGAEITVKTFLDRDMPCVFERISVKSKERCAVEIGLFLPDGVLEHIQFAANKSYEAERENEAVVFTFSQAEDVSVDLVYSFGTQLDETLCCKLAEYEKKADAEIAAIRLPASVKTEKEKALYYSSYFCALQNYKEIGEFKAFTAGCHYIAPVRTYYRDSYYTVLPMYNGQTEKVRNQIITLARGIEPDGKCPSAVYGDFSAWWGGHYDSPSMFCMEIYDYVNQTGDFTVLQEKVGETTVLELLEKVLTKLSENCDGTGLLIKAGKFNKRDWADEVNRYGYVTYNEILYARALYCFSRLVFATDAEKSKLYEERYIRVKNGINTLLWDEELGYYINFRNEDYTESNLSIDTVFAVIFDIADAHRAERLLDSCHRLLESRNHPDLEDFGVLSVYPLYSGMDCARKKSARPMDYHNGADWPYWSAMYAYALKSRGRDYAYPLTRWFDYNVQRGNYTPIEYYSPYCPDGSLLQGWSGVAAFVYDDEGCKFFQNRI